MPDPDYAALAAQHGGTPDYGALAQQFGGTSVADFKQSDTSPNELDPSPGWVRAAQQFYEKSGLSMLPGLAVAVGKVYNHPVDELFGMRAGFENLKAAAKAQWDEGVKAADAAKRAAAEAREPGSGSKVRAGLTAAEAVGHGLASIVPLLGPVAADVGEHFGRGDIAGGVGGVAGLGAAMVAGKAFEGVGRGPKGAPPGGRLTPAEASTNAFAEARGVPLDAATATGNRFVRSAQKVVSNLLGGSGTAKQAIRAQGEAMARVGSELADQAHPAFVNREQAVEGVRASMSDLINTLRKQAGEAYDQFAAEEQKLENRVAVPKETSTAEVKARQMREQSTLGHVVSDAELHELRRIYAEMESLPYVKRTWTEAPRNKGNAAGGKYDIAPGAGGAPVYHDILGEIGTGYTPTRGDVLKSINAAIEAGHYTDVGRAALEVAKKRIAGQWGKGVGQVTPASLPEEAGLPKTSVDMMPLAVSLRDVKVAMQPIYDRLAAENKIVPLQGPAANTLRALTRLVEGPNYVPMSVAEGVLGELKATSRGAQLPGVRNVSQGSAAFAITKLDQAIRATAQRASPEALQQLEFGRSATKAKYDVARVLKQLIGRNEEPKAMFDRLTAPQDSQIKFLRQVHEAAAAEMPKVGRAWLEEQLKLAGQEGGFGHADRLWSNWQKLGKGTKEILFGQPGLRAELDQFFLLAKRIAENPNPSGTAHTAMAAGQAAGLVAGMFTHPVAAVTSLLGEYGAAQLLYSRRGVQALTRAMRLEYPTLTRTGGQPVTHAAKVAAWAEVQAAAKAAGVRLPAAAATEPDSQSGR